MKCFRLGAWFIEDAATNAIIATNHLRDDPNIPDMRYLIVCNNSAFEIWTRVEADWQDLPVDPNHLESLKGIVSHVWDATF